MTIPQMYSSAFHMPMYFMILDRGMQFAKFHVDEWTKFVKKGVWH